MKDSNIEPLRNDGHAKKIILTANTGWYLYNFRKSLIKELNSDIDFRLVLVAPDDEYAVRLRSEGYDVRGWALSAKSINPFLEISAIFDLINIYRSERPVLVHHFTIKACIYGTIAAKLARVYAVVNAVTGLGHIFVGKKKRHFFIRHIVRPIYLLVFRARRSSAVFQNYDDQEKLVSLGVVDYTQTCMIAGSGIDIDHFSPESQRSRYAEPVRLLFPSRLMVEKGIIEFLDACKLLWKDGYKIQAYIAGTRKTAGRSAIKDHVVEYMSKNENIRFLGFVEDMRQLYQESDILVLPSWREGLSRVLIEASSMEMPIITSDVPGCRDIVEHGYNGMLVPVRDTHALYLAIKFYIANSELSFEYGRRARANVLKCFRDVLINRQTLSRYKAVITSSEARKADR